MSNKIHQQILLILQATPYYTPLTQIEAAHHTTTQPILHTTRALLHTFRTETRAGNTNAAQAVQESLDQNVKLIVDAYERNKREWNKILTRLAEDIGGVLGRTLLEVARGAGLGPAGCEMNLGRVIVRVARRMHEEE
ncbi:hypothetical protein EAE96_001863 [Botrytis aclada]|nr:hypothetical protein EAE96_001863 [Botrytis aclada]